MNYRGLRRFILIVFSAFLSVLLLTACEVPETKDNEKDVIEVAYGELFVGVNFNELTESITKRMRKSYQDVTISYKSSDPEVLSDDGVLTMSGEEVKLTLYITLSHNGRSVVKERQVTVPASPIYALSDGFFSAYDLNNLMSDLPISGNHNGVNVSYTSSDENVISSSGKVTMGEKDQTVILNAEFSMSGSVVLKEYTVKVPRNPLYDIRDSLFSNIDLKNITEHIDFPRDIPGGIRAEYVSFDPLAISHTGKVIRSAKDREVSVEVTFSLGDTRLVHTYDFTVKAISLLNKFERTYDDPTVYTTNLRDLTELLADVFRDPEKYATRSIIVDFDGTFSGAFVDFERYLELYGLEYEDIDLAGDSEFRVQDRKVRLISRYYGYDSLSADQTEEWTWYYNPHMVSILRQRDALDKGTYRGSEYNDFALYKTGKGTKEVLLPFDLVEAVAAGYTPTFPFENSKAEYYFECAKTILRDIITDDMSDLQKVTAITEYIASVGQYDNDSLYMSGTMGGENDNNRYICFYLDGFFDNNGRVVCNGFCDMMVLLCNLEGIPCVEIQGSGDWGHAWCQVNIDGKWATYCPTGANGRNEGWTDADGNRYDNTICVFYGYQSVWVDYTNFNRERMALDRSFPTIFNRPDEILANSLEENKVFDVFKESTLCGLDLYIESEEELLILLDAITENRVTERMTVAFAHNLGYSKGNSTIMYYMNQIGLTQAERYSDKYIDGDYVIDGNGYLESTNENITILYFK